MTPLNSPSRMAQRPQKGDRLWWRPQPFSPLRDRVFIEVTRVARDGSWADVRCFTWATSWTKRQRLPLPDYTTGFAWRQTHLDLQEQDWAQAREEVRRG